MSTASCVVRRALCAVASLVASFVVALESCDLPKPGKPKETRGPAFRNKRERRESIRINGTKL